MDIHFGGSIDGYVDILVADYVLGNDGATNRGTTIAAIDVDSHTAWSGGGGLTYEITGNRIKDDFVPTHVVGGKHKRGSNVRVQCDAPQSIMYERVPNDHVV